MFTKVKHLLLLGTLLAACGEAPVVPTLVSTAKSAPTATQSINIAPTPANATVATATPSQPIEGVVVSPIVILSPGAGSALVSSVQVVGAADPTFEQTLLVTISDASGKIVGEAATIIQADVGQRGPFNVDVPFTVASDQPGRVSVFSHSALDGGIVNLASVEVNLRAGGAAEVVPGVAGPALIRIRQPEMMASITGGYMLIQGEADEALLSQMGILLCGEIFAGDADVLCGSTGNVLAAAPVTPGESPGTFIAELSFAVPQEQSGRIVVYATSARDGGLVAVASQMVRLAP